MELFLEGYGQEVCRIWKAELYCICLLYTSTFMDRNKDCLLLPNQDDLRLGSGHSSIEQIPPQHDIVLFQKRNNDDRILLSLALMNGRTVGKLQILQHFLRVL